MATPLQICLICSIAAFTTSLYVDHGDPYKSGSLPTARFSLTKLYDHSPAHSVVITPSLPGQYALAFFVGGFDGVIPAEMYQVYLTNVASHGFIVVGTDYNWPASRLNTLNRHLKDKRSDKIVAEMDWIMAGNLQRHLDMNVHNVTCDLSHVGLFSHSAGADGILKVMERNQSSYQGVVFFEPMSFSLTKPINFSQPALIIGTELSTEHIPCIIKGYGYNHFYDFWSTPKILMEAKGYGHCDICDDGVRNMCNKDRVCYGANSTAIPEYRIFCQGVTVAFFSALLQGNTADLQYVTQEHNVPIALLEFKVNMTST